MTQSRRLDVLQQRFRPVYVVWELTLRCDHACAHCGSRAGEERKGELDTGEALGVVRQLAELGTTEVVLIGGEAYLHPGFLEIVAALRAAGITPVMTTGGRGVTAELAREMAAAGLARASVSIDGLHEAHDLLRAARGSFAAATAALSHLRAAGVAISSSNHGNSYNHLNSINFSSSTWGFRHKFDTDCQCMWNHARQRHRAARPARQPDRRAVDVRCRASCARRQLPGMPLHGSPRAQAPTPRRGGVELHVVHFEGEAGSRGSDHAFSPWVIQSPSPGSHSRM